jgi:Alw26I/Eco31I/Esp3I family type II restriction m6 adenine DNA methyltransferase
MIENCLFGVDINPKSVAICRLRLWIELLKNMYYTKESKFRELETLPNIDINIKCGNSLVSRFGLGNAQNLLPKDRLFVKNLIDKYKIQVVAYKSVKDLGAKDNIREQIRLLKMELEKFVVPNDKDFETLRKKEAELGQISFAFDAEEREKQVKLAEEATFLRQKYTQKLQTLYRNSFEWRFDFPEILDENGDFVGFDAIIGNPPYGLFNKKQNQKIALSVETEIVEILKTQYPEVQGGSVNAARIFYALGFKLLKDNGLQAMIIPFGILTDTTSAKLRKYIFENYCFFKIDAFPERDNMKRRVFEDVKMSTAIVFSSKGKLFSHFDIGISYQKEINTKERLNLQYADIQALNNDLLAIPLTSEKEFRILQKVYTLPNVQKLGTLSPCLTGEVDINLAKNAITKNKNKAILVKGVQIDRYLYKSENENISQGEIEFLDETIFQKSYKGEKLKHSQIERIVIQGLSGVNEEWRIKAMLLEPIKYLANSCNYLLPTSKISAQILLALLNSKLLNFIFKCNSTSSNVNGYEVDNLPILIPENPKPFMKLVNDVLKMKKIDAKSDISAKLLDIDKLVYKLYNLTEEEIAIIEEK